MTEAIRQRVREILDPFMARFEFEMNPGADDVQLSEVCRRLRLEHLPPAVDEFLRICGSPAGPAQELFAGETPLRVDSLLDYGWHSLKVARIWGAEPLLVAGAVPYSGSDYAVTWLRSPESPSSLEDGDLEIWWAREDEEFGCSDIAFVQDLEQRVRNWLGGHDGSVVSWPKPLGQPTVDLERIRSRVWLDDILDDELRGAFRNMLDYVEASTAHALADEDRESRRAIQDALEPVLEVLGRSPYGVSRSDISALCEFLGVDSLRSDLDEYLSAVGNDDELGGLLFPNGPLTLEQIIRHRTRIEALAEEVEAYRLQPAVALPGLGEHGGWIDLHGSVWELSSDDYAFVGTFTDLIRRRSEDAAKRLRGR